MRSRNSDVGPTETLTGWQALILGALHGPAELLPISSSGHVMAISWLLGWDYARLDPDLQKSFEVALHAGTLAALLAGGGLELERIGILAPASAPPALAGLVFERAIERHAGTPRSVATGLSVGALAMLLADRTPPARVAEEADTRDGVWLGVAQACALLPGISRSGATLTAARFLGFGRSDAQLLSARVATPVIAGATLLKGLRLVRRPPAGALAGRLALGAGASFASSLLAGRLMGSALRDRTPTPFAVYRLALAGVMFGRVIRGHALGHRRTT